jgi:peptidoglycan/xylan/chitin deacetylase (PgdA/CDA1 family)
MSDALTPRRHALPFRISRHVYRGAQILRTRHNTWAGLRILGYHRVSDDFDELAVSPAQFRDQMLTLRASGMRVVRLSDIETLAGLPTGIPHVCITFDDGYYDNLEHAVPVLAELAMPATIFLPTRIIDGEGAFHWYRSPPRALSWRHVHEMQDTGLIDFQCHTLTHPALPELDEAEARREISDGRHDLEQRLGRAVTAFCYPYGLFGSREAALVSEAGFRYAVTTADGVNGADQSPISLLRTFIHRDDSNRYFAAKLAGCRDSLSPLPDVLRRGPLKSK